MQQTRYLPFGGYRAGSGPNPITSYAYTSQQENMDIGLYYYNARYYAPTLARFLSPDTLIPDPANPQSLNRYAYTLNSPLNYSDPTGHFYYEPSCDCMVDNGNSKREFDSNLERAFQWDHRGGYRVGNFADGSTIPMNTAQKKPDAYAIGISGDIDLGKTFTAGTELVANSNSQELSIFVYGGKGWSLGEGANAAIYGSLIYNLPQNSQYRGPFMLFSGTLAAGTQGGTAGTFGVPQDLNNTLSPEGPFGGFIGYAVGNEASITITVVNYWEMITYNMQNGTLRVNILSGYLTFDFVNFAMSYEN